MNTSSSLSRLRRRSGHGTLLKRQTPNQSFARPTASSIGKTPLRSNASTGKPIAPSGSQPITRSTSINRPLNSQFSVGRSTIIGIPGSRDRNATPPVNSRPLTPRQLEIQKKQLEKKQMEEELSMLREKLQVAESKAELLSQKNELAEKTLAQEKGRVEILEAKTEILETKLTQTTDELTLKRDQCERLVEKLKENDTELRYLHNQVIDLKGKIRVAVRVRPLLDDEDCSTMIGYPEMNAISISQGAAVPFEKVFSPRVSQGQVFDNVKELIQSVLHGYNVSLIAFGQTGAGKTFTMRGGQGEQMGVIPRAVKHLLEQQSEMKILGWSVTFSASFIEIYNNEAYDLLNNNGKLKVMLSGNEVKVEGLVQKPIVYESDVEKLLQLSDTHRKTAATRCNQQSSRSHAIFQLGVHAKQEGTELQVTSMLKLVDLAGSERCKESGATGDRFKEMTFINQSLSALQKCINMQKKSSAHVPYRDTKLTSLLKDSLGGGNSKTMVIVNLNPCNEQISETKRSIEFAAKMRETSIGAAQQQINN